MAEIWIVRTGRWLTKRRGIILAPLFVAALISARAAPSVFWEWVLDLCGLACLAGGTRLRLLAASYHESSHHAEPITAGPYAWVRHPLYLSNFLLGLGVVLFSGWWPMIAFYVLFFLPVHFVIARSEELHLIGLYGQKYELYRRSVPAILPWRGRYAGPRYGSPSPFKLKQGKESLKTFGYLAGMAGFLVIKNLRQFFQLPFYVSMPRGLNWVLAAIAATAITLRPHMVSKKLRVAQTLLAVGCILAIVVRLPGVLPESRFVPVPEVVVAPVPLPVPVAVTAVPVIAEPVVRVEPARIPTPKTWVRIGSFFWNHLDLTGGAATFGIAAMVEEEKEERTPGGFKASDDLGDAGWVGLGVALALGLWKRLHSPAQLADVPSFKAEPLQMQVEPVVDRDGVGLVARFKRRF